MRGIARLKRRAEFLYVAAGRRKWAAPGLVLQARARPVPAVASGPSARQTAAAGRPEGTEAMRVGYTASRKVGMAVLRNRARRRLRSAVEQVMLRHAAPGHDYVVIARAETVRRPFAALVGDLETALRRLRLYREERGREERESAAAEGEAC